MSASINYSIIIPHKNIPQLLQRCLDSIPLREDIQIIIVDDNSDPGKVDFQDFPGLNRPGVEIVLTKEGKGAGYARNIGLKKAVGRWILFADSDDFFNNVFLEAIDSYVTSDADIIYFDYNCAYSDTLEPCKLRMFWVSDYLKNKDANGLRYNSAVPWAKMISRSLIEKYHFRFDETKASNDVMFSTYIGHYADVVEISQYIIYCATERSDSLWFGMALDSLEARLRVACRYNSFVEKIGYPAVKYRIYSYVWVDRSKSYGMKAYIKLLLIYLKQESLSFIYKDFCNLFKAKLNK